MTIFDSLIRRTLRPTEPASVSFSSPIAPDHPFFAIGDIHGDFDRLDALLERIEARGEASSVVFLGDYIDRGERSADVLAWLVALARDYPDQVHCLKGNHEQMFLDFLDGPEKHGRRWLQFGGLQTLASFGVGMKKDTTMVDLRDAVVAAMDPGMIDWLRGLPLAWSNGNLTAVHAGADPRLPLDRQSAETLLWGHPDFFTVPRNDGVWIVHGHTIVDAPTAEAGRIAVDTGSYATGRLTAARIDHASVEFLTT